MRGVIEDWGRDHLLNLVIDSNPVSFACYGLPRRKQPAYTMDECGN
jgi:hypothetical protein